MSSTITPTVFYCTLNVEGLEIFYREAGAGYAPTVLLLHGFPRYGESAAPLVNDFFYSFDRLASVTDKFTEKLNLSSYALYLSDIGASIGFRLAVTHPERVTAMIVQNGGAHREA